MCGSNQFSMSKAEMRIRGQKDSGSWIRIRIKEFKYFFTQKIVSRLSRKYDPGCSSRIRILIFYPSRIQGLKGTGSRIRIRNTRQKLLKAGLV
jgi:hypothetical protein